MKTLIDHAVSLSRYCDETVGEIVSLIVNSKFIIDEDSLLCYSVERNCFGNQLVIEWEDGNGEKMWEWIKDIATRNHCLNIIFISRRWKALCRRYKCHPVGVVCKRRWVGNEDSLPAFDKQNREVL